MRQSSKLTMFLGERDRVQRGSLIEVVADLVAKHETRAAIVLRASEGFGPKHREQAADLLSLSDDLPLMVLVIDHGEQRLDALIQDITDLHSQARFHRSTGHEPQSGSAPLQAAAAQPSTVQADPQLQLTMLFGRRTRIDGKRGHLKVLSLMHTAGLAGAAAFLGVDGVVDGRRARARFLAANAEVPMAVVGVGDRERVTAAARALREMLPGAPLFLEPARLLKREGARREPLPSGDAEDEVWQLTISASEQTLHHGIPLGSVVIRRLRAQGLPGATSLRGVWGFHGDHPPHGDRFWTLRRAVPLTTTIVCTPTEAREAFAVIDELTDATGLVTLTRGIRSRA